MLETFPIYFSSLELENVRCFGESQMLKLTRNGRPARWSLLIGENGAGKTTLLECLAWMRPALEVNGVSGTAAGLEDRLRRSSPPSSAFLSSALTGEENEVLETLPRNGSREVSLKAKLSFGDACPWLDGPLEGARSQTEDICLGVRLSFDEKAVLHELEPQKTAIEGMGDLFHHPLIVSYGANRYLGYRNSIGVEELDPWDHKRLSRSTELYDVEEILLTLDYAAQAGPSAPEFSSLGLLKKAISKILHNDQDDESIQIHPPDVLKTGRLSGAYVKTFTGLVQMHALSLGHRTTTGWIVDLAWRLINRYPESRNPLEEPAIVLIDEIDLHLHPRWQLRIMKDLSSLFPATQFIATSHSPLIVQRVAEEANLILLQKRDDCVDIVNDTRIPRNLRVDQILTSLLFGVSSSRDDNTERLFTLRAELSDKTDRSQEEEHLLSDVRRQIDELPTAPDGSDRDAMDRIRRFAARLGSSESNEL